MLHAFGSYEVQRREMDELKIVKLAELRSKIGGIPVKLLVTF